MLNDHGIACCGIRTKGASQQLTEAAMWRSGQNHTQAIAKNVQAAGAQDREFTYWVKRLIAEIFRKHPVIDGGSAAHHLKLITARAGGYSGEANALPDQLVSIVDMRPDIYCAAGRF